MRGCGLQAGILTNSVDERSA